MQRHVTLITFSLLCISALTAYAAGPFVDKLCADVYGVSAQLANGRKREEILSDLQAGIKKYPKSPGVTVAEEMCRELSASIEGAAKRAKAGLKVEEVPHEFLEESKIPLYLLAYAENKRSIADFAERHPDDPAILVLKQGRGAIERLIPALQNRSPIPGDAVAGFRDSKNLKNDRVCDLAMRLIEYLSLCKFHFNASSRTAFHDLKPEERQQRIARIEEWWKENKNRTVIEGIRSQLPHAEFYEQLAMVKDLIREAEKVNSKADKEFGLEMMRGWLPGDNYAYTADALVEFGDYSAVDVFYKALNDSVNVQGRYWSRETNMVFYLTKYGKRREWELLLKIAEKELEQGKDVGEAGVWPALVNCHDATKTPFMIPGLGLALGHTKNSGSRFVNEKVGSQNFSIADQATQYLQELTKVDFGYRVDDSEEMRLAAIKKAQKWWVETGKAKYTFEYIEREMVNNAK